MVERSRGNFFKKSIQLRTKSHFCDIHRLSAISVHYYCCMANPNCLYSSEGNNVRWVCKRSHLPNGAQKGFDTGVILILHQLDGGFPLAVIGGLLHPAIRRDRNRDSSTPCSKLTIALLSKQSQPFSVLLYRGKSPDMGR
jgi:hypothetical protein